MSIENPFNNPTPPQEEAPKLEKVEEAKNPKDIFFNALNEELSAMEKAGRLSPEQAEEKRKSAALIETGFSDDPVYDALLFSRAGIADEKETIAIFDKKNAEKELTAPENPEVDSSIADFVGITESARHAYGERMEKNISETERLELIQAVLSNGRVKRYFERIVPRIKEGLTVEEIIAQDKAEVEARKEITEKEETFETTLRLAEIVVQHSKEKQGL
ncbi:MAG: hypothetical protein A3F54_02115 [Candidatus Kerfeldbacteria bacterium RIFCSPHIGHO2_12_FULL_48_17]|uniref:Uncharacterized protein n=1 Tax=Candidatus Kerfeldbacteria bacterium RIFCSPHIGHO2_12_FULL_48_17 TaxID=1798542 RepID=A0A1G2AZN3_9BACT|nr:MAG: hypothetical protein A3F54_02115 [Candidatus Kerfeldbacteria bacterium RIFCSPHIGHO2_12_FULL_48_17]